MLAVVVVATSATGLFVVVSIVTLVPLLLVTEAPATASSKTPATFDSRVTTRPFEIVLLSAEDDVAPYSAIRVVEAPTVV